MITERLRVRCSLFRPRSSASSTSPRLPRFASDRRRRITIWTRSSVARAVGLHPASAGVRLSPRPPCGVVGERPKPPGFQPGNRGFESRRRYHSKGGSDERGLPRRLLEVLRPSVGVSKSKSVKSSTQDTSARTTKARRSSSSGAAESCTRITTRTVRATAWRTGSRKRRRSRRS